MARNTREIRIRKQLRGFALLWTGITFAMGTITFIAIYIGYNSLANDTTPRSSATAQSVIAAANPTVQINTPTLFPTRDPAAFAAQRTTAPILPSVTPLPIEMRRFQLGVQVQVSYDIMDQWIDVAANQLSVKWVKQQVRWEDIQPARDTYDWGALDVYLPAAQRQNVRVLISVVTAPDWAREEGANLERHGPPADPQDYADFVTAILARYPGMVHALEVWNEQNLDREWTSTRGLTASTYVELLRTTYQAVKAVDPGVIVISGALSPTGVSDGVTAWDDFVYFDQLIEAGMLNYADCIGAHHNGINVSPDDTWDNVTDDPTATYRGPYDNPHHSWSFRSTLQTYASKVALAGGDQKLCVTEFGWASADGLDGLPEGFGFAADNTLDEQRDYTVRALDNMVEWDIVWLAVLWNLNYGAQAGWEPTNDNVPYAIIGPNSFFRPVFDAVRDWNRAYEAQFQ